MHIARPIIFGTRALVDVHMEAVAGHTTMSVELPIADAAPRERRLARQ